jgi:NADPH:quinone reductase-like Zn-dependent oxidoreductase
VGSAVLQLARTMGVRVIATASAADEDWCRQCGAER